MIDANNCRWFRKKENVWKWWHKQPQSSDPPTRPSLPQAPHRGKIRCTVLVNLVCHRHARKFVCRLCATLAIRGLPWWNLMPSAHTFFCITQALWHPPDFLRVTLFCKQRTTRMFVVSLYKFVDKSATSSWRCNHCSFACCDERSIVAHSRRAHVGECFMMLYLHTRVGLFWIYFLAVAYRAQKRFSQEFSQIFAWYQKKNFFLLQLTNFPSWNTSEVWVSQSHCLCG